MIIFLTLGTNALAQGFFRDKFLKGDHIEVGVHTGPSLYIGELNDNLIGFNRVNLFKFSSWNVGASLKQYFSSTSVGDRTWGIRLDYNFTQINGTGAEPNAPVSTNPDHHLRFSNNMHEFALLGEFHFWEFRPTRERNLITPYALAGVGGIYHDPKAPNPDGTGKPQSLVDHYIVLDNRFKASKFAATIPFGAGIKYNVTPHGKIAKNSSLSVGIEFVFRYAFSDFLDGINNDYYIDHSSMLRPTENITDLANQRRKLNRYYWQKLVSPSTSENRITLSNSLIEELQYQSYNNLVGRPRGHKGNDFFMTTVLKATWTFYKYRDPSWK